MWVFTNKGFLSIVQHKDMPGHFQVRARTRRPLEELWPRSTCPGNRVGGLPVPHIHQEGGGSPSTNRGDIGNRIYELQELMQG